MDAELLAWWQDGRDQLADQRGLWPAARECVATLVAETSARLGVPPPEVRWFRP